jgi:glycosyltransferase involved in cell wall biosynthesis
MPMTTETPPPARVSIVVVPRERYGMAKESLASVLAESPQPFELIYVSGKPPAALAAHVDAEAARHGFRHVKLDRFLSPNEARNIGVAAATGEFIVFLDNDVLAAPGWLPPLVACADETGADVVVPLTCHGKPAHAVVHQAGGMFAEDPAAFFAQPRGAREVLDVMHHQNDKVAELKLERTETQICEFHAVMVRRSLFDRIGPLDEGMLATKEHLDFCMSTIQAGGKIVFEPASILTYVFPNRHNPITRDDMPYFLVRWSPEWQRRSIRHFEDKWGLKPDSHAGKRAMGLSARHNMGIVRPWVARFPWVGRNELVQKVGGRALRPIVRRMSDAAVAREDQRRSRATTAQAAAANTVRAAE